MRAIDAEKAIEIIESKQKELCPVGRDGRNYVYGSDREKYDAWDEIIDVLENLPTLTPPNEWIRVEDRLPKSIINKVLVYCENGYIGYGYYADYKGEKIWYNRESGKPFSAWDIDDCNSYKVTHWMPLPDPPNKNNTGFIKKKHSEPLTLDELLSINHVPIWVVDKTNNRQEWCYWRNGLAYACEDWPEHYDINDYGKWIAFYYPTEKGEE